LIDADDIDHLLETLNIPLEAREEVPDADHAAALGDHASVVR
jgi:hypothetical protein